MKNEVLVQNQYIKLYQTALFKGDKVISYAVPQRINGKTEFKLLKLKPDVTQQAQAERAKHSAFRLKYFNWGPFKVLPDQKYTDELVAKSAKSDEAILANARKTFDSFVKEGQIKKAALPPENNDIGIQEANKYLMKEAHKDFQNETSLEDSTEINTSFATSKTKTIEMNRKPDNLE